MPTDPHTTKKFPKVIPIQTPEPFPRSGSEPFDGRSSRASSIPDWYDDERPTQRGVQGPVAAPVSTSSQERPLLTVLGGLNAGQVFTLDRAETLIGRGRDAHIAVDDVGISRKHARIVRVDGAHFLEDLGSANGVFVNGAQVQRAALSGGDRVQIGPGLVLRFRFASADEQALAIKLYEGSTHDALTGLYNRRYASERLASEVAYARRHGTHFSFVLFDLDHFKNVNDGFGHQAGDGVLRVVAAQVRKAIRTEDVLARYGGEEFVVLVRGIERKSVGVLAERVRRAVERLVIPWESRTIEITVSVGMASLSECSPNAPAEALVALADERLYKAKAGGRNRVCGSVESRDRVATETDGLGRR
jgi:two-component system cell cycle response regulator